MRDFLQRSFLLKGLPLAAALWSAGCSQPCVDPFTEGTHNIREWVELDQRPIRDERFRPLDELVLYLDSSLSMKGYADPNGRFEYGKALGAVRNVVDELAPPHRIKFRQVREDIGPLSADQRTVFDAARNPSFYTGTASNIAAAIRSFEDQIAADTPGIARCHLLVTDGVQHTSAADPDPNCARGNDPACVNAAIRRLIQQGWGVHLFGVRSRYKGRIFSELAQKWLTGDYSATSENSPSSFRPFLIFVFTNEASYLEHLVEKFRAELDRSGIDPRLTSEMPLTLRLVRASKIDLDTESFRIASEFELGAKVPNPLVHQTHRDWRQDFDGVALPEHIRMLEYGFEDENFLEPFALRVSAQLEFTEAGKILFGQGAADAGNLVKTLTVTAVPRPERWSGDPDAEPKPPTPLRGSGLGSDEEDEREGSEGESDEDRAPTPLEAPLAPLCGEFKKLNFNGLLQKEFPEDYSIQEGGPGCSFSDGCNLFLAWSKKGTLLPVTLLRVDGLLDPSKILPPKWIDDWSTNDDTRLSNGNRILNLDRLVKGLIVNEHIAKQGLSPYYLMIWPNKK